MEAKFQFPYQILTVQCHRLKLWDSPDLKAPFWRLYFNLDSGAFIRIGHQRMALDPGRLYLIPQEFPFSPELEREVKHLFIHFFMHLELMKGKRKVYSFNPGNEIAEQSENMARLLLNNTFVGPGLLSMHASLLLSYGLSRIPNENWVKKEGHERLAPLIQQLESAHYPAYSNPELARIVHMNTNAFIRLFSREVGQSPQTWLRMRRIDLACHYLAHTTMSLEQISETLGFSSRSHFSLVFKKYRNLSPALYRQLSR